MYMVVVGLASSIAKEKKCSIPFWQLQNLGQIDWKRKDLSLLSPGSIDGVVIHYGKYISWEMDGNTYNPNSRTQIIWCYLNFFTSVFFTIYDSKNT